jgi:hypothetical protein
VLKWYSPRLHGPLPNHHVGSEVGAQAEGSEAGLWALEQEALQAFWRDRCVEVVVLVEGTDPLTSNSLQARYSYTVEDLRFDHEHAPCVFSHRGRALLDFTRFNRTRPAVPPTTQQTYSYMQPMVV